MVITPEQCGLMYSMIVLVYPEGTEFQFDPQITLAPGEGI